MRKLVHPKRSRDTHIEKDRQSKKKKDMTARGHRDERLDERLRQMERGEGAGDTSFLSN